MRIRKFGVRAIASAFAITVMASSSNTALALDPNEEDFALKELGKYVFFDKISTPARMACASCHDPDTGGTGTNSGVNLHQVAVTGANPHTVGNLKPPTNAYASFIAPFHDCTNGLTRLCGGNFWDGRAEGREDKLYPNGATKHIGDEVFQGVPAGHQALGYDKYFGPTSDQALNPMPNPVEQNIERQAVCEQVAAADYAPLFKQAWGVAISCGSGPASVSAPDADGPESRFDISFKRLMLAVGAWQHSNELNSFSSKRDNALRAEIACVEGSPDADPAVCSDPKFVGSPGEFPLVGLTDAENLGHDIFYSVFNNPAPGLPVANCSVCHSDNPGGPGAPRDSGAELHQLYADDSFHNIGVPKNPEVPQAYDEFGNPIDADLGLMAHTGRASDRGAFKTPTTRNVDKRKGKGFTKAYGHNGWFKSLESIVHFYNTANVNGATAAQFGVTRCPAGVETEKQALANNCWPAPAAEVSNIAIPFLVGDLGMTLEQEAALVAYMKALTDLETPTKPAPYKSSKKSKK